MEIIFGVAIFLSIILWAATKRSGQVSSDDEQ